MKKLYKSIPATNKCSFSESDENTAPVQRNKGLELPKIVKIRKITRKVLNKNEVEQKIPSETAFYLFLVDLGGALGDPSPKTYGKKWVKQKSEKQFVLGSPGGSPFLSILWAVTRIAHGLLAYLSTKKDVFDREVLQIRGFRETLDLTCP